MKDETFDIVCIRWGTKYGHEYVMRLYDQVRAGTTRLHDFICFTDQPERQDGIRYEPCFSGSLQGWYQKLGLFKPGVLTRPTLFLDLDVIVTGSLEKFLDWPCSFGISEDFIWQGFNSSVMFITPGTCPELYEHFVRDPYVHRKGDQGIIEEFLPEAKTFPRDWCLSYKADKVKEKPKDAIVIFHGKPNPPDCDDQWIKEFWP